jgi:hypothetical protein
MAIRLMLTALLTSALLIGGCGLLPGPQPDMLPSAGKLPEPVLSDSDRKGAVKSLEEAAQNHGAEAAKTIATTR